MVSGIWRLPIDRPRVCETESLSQISESEQRQKGHGGKCYLEGKRPYHTVLWDQRLTADGVGRHEKLPPWRHGFLAPPSFPLGASPRVDHRTCPCPARQSSGSHATAPHFAGAWCQSTSEIPQVPTCETPHPGCYSACSGCVTGRSSPARRFSFRR
jgi:hypothetical protein